MPRRPPITRPPVRPPITTPVFDLTGVWRCDDGGIYYIRQLGDTVVWAGLHDSGFHKGIEFANVFHGNYGADGQSVIGEWADVPRGKTNSSGILRFTITRDDVGQVELVKDPNETSGGFGGAGWWYDGELLERHDIVGVTKRVRRFDGWAGENNPPCRDFTVMSGFVLEPLQGPTLPPDPYDYCSFVTSDGGIFGWGGDGDFTFDLQPDFDLTDQDFWTTGWVPNSPPAFAPETPSEHIQRLFDHVGFFHCENAMYGRSNSDDDCADTPNVLLPGWNEPSGNSILVNGRPLEGRVISNPAGGGGDQNLSFTFEIGPNGKTVDLLLEHFVRVTGVVADDAGHEGDAAPEIHPVYQIDIVQDFQLPRPQPTLSGAWHGSESGTYYIRQLGDNIWWLGLSRDQGRSFANVFRGTFDKNAGVIEGEWVDVPLGVGGVLSGGTLRIEGEEHSNRILKISETAPFGATSWWKLYDTPGVPAGSPGYELPRVAR
jgi:hypothetical protein